MLADVVRAHRDEVVEYARSRLAELIPERAAHEASGYLPSLLDDIVADLGDPQVDAEIDARVAARAADHGRARQQVGADPRSVVHEFGVICDAVAEIARRAGVPIAASDWQKLNRALDHAIAEAISGFEAARRADERQASAAALGSVAHELRNALGAAAVAFEAVQRGRVGAASRTAEIVKRNLKQAALLAGNLVVDSKVDGRRALTVATHPLRAIVEDVVASVSVAANVTSEVRIDPQLVVVADKLLLISALTNLVENAFKFTRAGGRVTIRARACAEATTIEVEDECGGLPPARAETLFAPSVQAGADRTGAGLGLSVVRKIMLAHGGGVRVRDLAGRGCVFELSFPRCAP